MKNLLCLLIVTLFGVVVSAQKVHFVYFETDNAQPFYLKMDDKVYSSSSTGSFLLPNLTDSTYHLSIGFPSTSTEAKFRLAVSGKDYGYAIRNFDFGVGLFDMQSLSVTKPQEDKWKSNVSYQYRNNDFTSLLAKASNDTSLFYVPVITKEEPVVQKTEEKKEEIAPNPEPPKTDTATQFDTNAGSVAVIAAVRPVEKNNTPFVFPGVLMSADTTAIRKEVVTDPGTTSYTVIVGVNDTTGRIDSTIGMVQDSMQWVKLDSVVLEPETKEVYKPSKVRRHAESSTSEGFGLVYYDVFEGGTDTIKLIIPNPKIIFKEPDTTQFEDGMLELKKDTQVIASPPAEVKKAVPKSNCSATASDNDFFKLRRNMAAKESDEDMINEAKKVFKNKCFSTGQIKNLSTLFLNDAGKYQFFDAAYMHVNDQEVFYALQAELKDEYYLKRFKALIGE